jgi:hypothetical protein
MICSRSVKHATNLFSAVPFSEIQENTMFLPPYTTITEFRHKDSIIMFEQYGFKGAYEANPYQKYMVVPSGTVFTLVQDSLK